MFGMHAMHVIGAPNLKLYRIFSFEKMTTLPSASPAAISSVSSKFVTALETAIESTEPPFVSRNFNSYRNKNSKSMKIQKKIEAYLSIANDSQISFDRRKHNSRPELFVR
jgi:hypothetical protein